MYSMYIISKRMRPIACCFLLLRGLHNEAANSKFRQFKAYFGHPGAFKGLKSQNDSNVTRNDKIHLYSMFGTISFTIMDFSSILWQTREKNTKSKMLKSTIVDKIAPYLEQRCIFFIPSNILNCHFRIWGLKGMFWLKNWFCGVTVLVATKINVSHFVSELDTKVLGELKLLLAQEKDWYSSLVRWEEGRNSSTKAHPVQQWYILEFPPGFLPYLWPGTFWCLT